MTFQYPCPDCGTTDNLHDLDCEYEGVQHQRIEKAYVDIISVLLAEGASRKAMDAPPGITFSDLTSRVSENLKDQPEPEMWKDIHTDCLHSLKDHRRVDEKEELGGLFLKTPEEQAKEIIPTFDPIQTIYECGPVDGCKDYAVYTMVSWCELVGLDWEQTCNFLHEWLAQTQAWQDLSWGESSIQELLDSKKHVHERGLGWGDYADIAAREIREAGRSRRINAQEKLGVEADHYG